MTGVLPVSKAGLSIYECGFSSVLVRWCWLMSIKATDLIWFWIGGFVERLRLNGLIWLVFSNWLPLTIDVQLFEA